MSQEDKKLRPGFMKKGTGGSGDEEKGPKKTPRFSIYWIYAMIAIVLIGYNFLSFNPEALPTTEQDFKEKMLLTGDVDHLDYVTNKKVVRIYIKKDSIC